VTSGTAGTPATHWRKPVGFFTMSRPLVRICFLIVGLVAAVLLSTALGSVRVPPGELWDALTGEASDRTTIVRDLRLPRALLGAIVGAALAASGAAYQSLFRNPLADPFVIGSASGAALGATLVIAFGHAASVGVPLGAFVGSILATGGVYLFAALGRSGSLVHLLLAGAAASSFLSALVWLVLATKDQNAMQVLAWLMGNLAGKSWHGVTATLPWCFAGIALLALAARPLDALALGDGAARSLGLPVGAATAWIVGAASLATAGAVAAGGIIGFVGMIAPHIARRLVGPTHRRLVPAAALAGAVLLVASDLLARTLVMPTELPVGVVTALLGAPLFLAILWNHPKP
jgi:iron complex transport system permease protein